MNMNSSGPVILRASLLPLPASSPARSSTGDATGRSVPRTAFVLHWLCRVTRGSTAETASRLIHRAARRHLEVFAAAGPAVCRCPDRAATAAAPRVAGLTATVAVAHQRHRAAAEVVVAAPAWR